MDAKYLAEIKAREQAATPGPWVVRENKSFGVQSENKNIACCFRQENENFIAHARTDIPALIAEVERLQNLCEENEQLIERLANQSRRLNDSGVTKDQQIATLKSLGESHLQTMNALANKLVVMQKALEIASKEVNAAFEVLESHHIVTMTQRASSTQENIDVWILQAQEQEGKE